MAEAVEWSGILASVGLLSTIVLGVLFRRAHFRLFGYHRVCGIATVVMGACHGILALVHWSGG